VIVLDTSALRSVAVPHDAVLTMILQLARQAGQRVALPEVVLREYLSHHRRDLISKIKAAQDAVQHLLGAQDDWANRETWRFLDYPDVDAAVAAMDHRLRTEFHTLVLTEAVAKGGLFREIDRKAPASTDLSKKGSGARDATIWLTVLEQCTASPGEQIFFVANDSDFGTQSLRPDLVPEAPANLVYCHGLAAVLQYLADPDQTAAEEARKAMYTSEVRDAMSRILSSWEVLNEIYGPPLPIAWNWRTPTQGRFTGSVRATICSPLATCGGGSLAVTLPPIATAARHWLRFGSGSK
jgi:hypothetical protein